MLNYKTKQQKYDHNLTMDLTLNNQKEPIYIYLSPLFGRSIRKDVIIK